MKILFVVVLYVYFLMELKYPSMQPTEMT